MISFQKIHGLYGLEHHTMEINGDVTMVTNNTQTREYRATQVIDLEAEFRNMLLDKMPLQRWMQHERQNRNDNVEVDGGRSLGGGRGR